VDQSSGVANKRQDALQTTGLEDSASFPCANQFHDLFDGKIRQISFDGVGSKKSFDWIWKFCSVIHLDALLGQVAGSALLEVGRAQASAQGLDSSVDGDDASSAFGRYVQVISDGAGRHFQHRIGRRLVQKDTAQGRQKRPRWTAVVCQGEKMMERSNQM
jgi:hypothetical protein